MKTIVAVILAFSATAAVAACTSQIISMGGKTTVCTTCCTKNICNTVCN